MSGCLDSLGEIKVFIFIAKSEEKGSKTVCFLLCIERVQFIRAHVALVEKAVLK